MLDKRKKQDIIDTNVRLQYKREKIWLIEKREKNKEKKLGGRKNE